MCCPPPTCSGPFPVPRCDGGQIGIVALDRSGVQIDRIELAEVALPDFVRDRENRQRGPRTRRHTPAEVDLQRHPEVVSAASGRRGEHRTLPRSATDSCDPRALRTRHRPEPTPCRRGLGRGPIGRRRTLSRQPRSSRSTPGAAISRRSLTTSRLPWPNCPADCRRRQRAIRDGCVCCWQRNRPEDSSPRRCERPVCPGTRPNTIGYSPNSSGPGRSVTGNPRRCWSKAEQVRDALEDPRVEPRLPEPAAVLPAQCRDQRRLDLEMGS